MIMLMMIVMMVKTRMMQKKMVRNDVIILSNKRQDKTLEKLKLWWTVEKTGRTKTRSFMSVTDLGALEEDMPFEVIICETKVMDPHLKNRVCQHVGSAHPFTNVTFRAFVVSRKIGHKHFAVPKLEAENPRLEKPKPLRKLWKQGG